MIKITKNWDKTFFFVIFVEDLFEDWLKMQLKSRPIDFSNSFSLNHIQNNLYKIISKVL